MKYIKLFENFRKDKNSPINEGCFDKLSTDQINQVVNEDDLNNAMFIAQQAIGIDDGGVCGIYWSHTENDAEDEWESLNPDERLYHLQKYLELEDKYEGLSENNSDELDIGVKTSSDEFRNADAYLYAGTISGDGYSDPTLEIYRTLEDAINAQKVDIKTQTGWWDEDDYEMEVMGENDISYESDDYWRFRVIPIKTDKKVVLVWYYEPNEVGVIGEFDNVESAISEMNSRADHHITDPNEDDNPLIRSGHGDEFYEHYQVFELPR